MQQISITIVGNLVGDPELRFTPSGAAACRFTIAHNPRVFNREANEWKDGEPTFFDCTVWRDLAEHVAESLRRGHRVILMGNLKTRRWESDGSGKTAAGDTITRQELEVLAIGPELTFATATVVKATRTARGETPPDDPWASASKTRPATVGAAGRFDDEPPF
jgi:single-strand DNA-binding protein